MKMKEEKGFEKKEKGGDEGSTHQPFLDQDGGEVEEGGERERVDTQRKREGDHSMTSRASCLSSSMDFSSLVAYSRTRCLP